MIAVAAAIKATSAGPVLFRQERFGLNRRRFVMLKFRTMVHDAERLQAALEEQNEAEGPVFKIALDPRITPLGRILRRTSIDELPQLFNVLNGEMSLVGPRPLPSRDVSRIARASDMRRFSVRPGITGLWQVSGRASLDFEKWIRLDLSYIDGWSLFLDIAILARTVPAVVRGTGAT
jgi:lipopolysaccharide/colanic/teichoic acid biosynthesis glycosyltransferase